MHQVMTGKHKDNTNDKIRIKKHAWITNNDKKTTMHNNNCHSKLKIKMQFQKDSGIRDKIN